MSDTSTDPGIDLTTIGEHALDLTPEMRRIRTEAAKVNEENERLREAIAAAEQLWQQKVNEAHAAHTAIQKIMESQALLGDEIEENTDALNETLEGWKGAFERFEDAHRPEPGAKPAFPPRGEMVVWSVRMDEVLVAGIAEAVEHNDESKAAFIRRAVTRELARTD